MNPRRLQQITVRYGRLRLAVVGDFCLDRYLEIDPRRAETSIETGLPVRNVVNVRAQPGGAGTILNNLVALGIGELYPVGFCGFDGEGYELRRALETRRGVRLDHFVQTQERRTFTYCKPLLMSPGKPPVELNRLDSKNWTPAPRAIQEKLAQSIRRLTGRVDAFIVLDQVDAPETGVVTKLILQTLRAINRANPTLPILADSRQGLRHFPPLIFKMNAVELAASRKSKRRLSLAQMKTVAAAIAQKNRQPVFVTLAERGILAAAPDGQVEHVPTLPVRGPIDIVGAGDSVTANLAAALAAGANLREAIELANAAASVVIHQLGTTGTASVRQIRDVLN
jgi:rfaE bifunctional protein kinase chain/domain